MATYKVWYMKPDWFRDGIMGDKPDPKNLEKTHTFLKDFELDVPLMADGDKWALERVWVGMQGENWSPNGEARGLIEEKGLRHTSMSVGDVVVDPEGKAFVVASMGFSKL